MQSARASNDELTCKLVSPPPPPPTLLELGQTLTELTSAHTNQPSLLLINFQMASKRSVLIHFCCFCLFELFFRIKIHKRALENKFSLSFEPSRRAHTYAHTRSRPHRSGLALYWHTFTAITHCEPNANSFEFNFSECVLKCDCDRDGMAGIGPCQPLRTPTLPGWLKGKAIMECATQIKQSA